MTAVASCQKKKNDNPVPLEKSIANDREEVDLVFKHSTVQCSDSNECPEWMASLIVADLSNMIDAETNKRKYDISYCSATLIDKNKILTNRHCIPERVIREKLSCGDHLHFKFPKTKNRDTQNARCLKILEQPQNFISRPGPKEDWIIIELDKTLDRQYLEIVRNGIPENTKYSIYPVYYFQSFIDIEGRKVGVADARIYRRDCESHMNSPFAMQYRHPYSPSFVGVCGKNIIPGNSGSGVVSNNKLIGLLSFTQAPRKVFIGPWTSFITPRSHGGFNLSCLPQEGKKLSPFCELVHDTETLEFGLLSSVLSSLIPNDLIKHDIVDIVDHDMNFVWEENDLRFFESIIKENRNFVEIIFNNRPHESENYLRNKLKKHFPYTPNCIVDEIKNQVPVKLKFPIYTNDIFNSHLNSLGLIEMPVDIKHLTYEFDFDNSSNSYIGTLVSLTDEVKDSYGKKLNEYSENLNKCLVDGFVNTRKLEFSHDCHKAKELLNELNKIKVESGLEPSLFDNYYWQKQLPELISLKVPACGSK